MLRIAQAVALAWNAAARRMRLRSVHGVRQDCVALGKEASNGRAWSLRGLGRDGGGRGWRLAWRDATEATIYLDQPYQYDTSCLLQYQSAVPTILTMNGKPMIGVLGDGGSAERRTSVFWKR